MTTLRYNITLQNLYIDEIIFMIAKHNIRKKFQPFKACSKSFSVEQEHFNLKKVSPQNYHNLLDSNPPYFVNAAASVWLPRFFQIPPS